MGYLLGSATTFDYVGALGDPRCNYRILWEQTNNGITGIEYKFTITVKLEGLSTPYLYAGYGWGLRFRDGIDPATYYDVGIKEGSTNWSGTAEHIIVKTGMWFNKTNSGNINIIISYFPYPSQYTVPICGKLAGTYVLASGVPLYVPKVATIAHGTLPVDGTIFDADPGDITISYTENTSGDTGATTVQYSINDLNTWNDVLGSGNIAGSFVFKCRTIGETFTIKLKRKHGAGVVYDSTVTANKTLYTYHTPSITGLALKDSNLVDVTTINANNPLTMSWDNWDFHTGKESSTVSTKIQYYNDNEYRDLFIIGSSVLNPYTFTPTVNLSNSNILNLLNYDNQNLYLLNTRTHDQTGDTATSRIPFKLLFRPTQSIILADFTSTIILKDIEDSPDSTSITWSHDSTGNKGIVSGYKFILSATGVTDKIFTPNTSPFTISKTDLIAGKYYKLTAYAYYSYNNVEYKGPETIIDNFIIYDKGGSVPVITYPTNNSYWRGSYLRICIKMPTDGNYIDSSYRYKDIQVMINGIYTYGIILANGSGISNYNNLPSNFSLSTANLIHECDVVFRCPLSISNYGDISIKVKVQKTVGWTEWSNITTIKRIEGAGFGNLPTSHTTNTSKILTSEINTLINYTKKMADAYGINSDGVSLKVVGEDKILASDFNYLRDILSSIATKVNNSPYIYNNIVNKMKVPTTFNDISSDTLIQASANDYFAKLSTMITELSSYAP